MPHPLTANGDGEQPLNIIVPIGGLGTRFAKHGYRYPKPLINIIGRPMLLWLIDNLRIRPADTLWMAINEDVDDEFRIGQLVAKSFPKLDLRMLRLRHQTKGASETLYVVAQSMDSEHLERRTVSLDCDTIYWADLLQRVREMPVGHSGCFYFEDQGDSPIFSYIKTEKKTLDGNVVEQIVDIAEKRAISKKANTGAYVFSSAKTLREWAATTLDERRDNYLLEYFTSQMISNMIVDGQLPFLGIPVEASDFDCVGTPQQLKTLLAKLKSQGLGQAVAEDGSASVMVRKRRFCFDLDMTLVGVPKIPGDYSTCPPIERNIRLVQQLYKAGHYIIIQTARRMRTHHGNIGSVLADVGPVTFAQLAKYEIPFHDIHFGKPYADVYIDDLAVNSNLDTMTELGWLLEDADLEEEGKAKKAAPGSNVMIAARDFNTIQVIGDKVIKSSKSDNILGELFFYSHLPPSLHNLFPAIYAIDYIEPTGTYTMTMENIKGLTYSHLLVGRSLTRGRLLLLMRALRTIHHTGDSSSVASSSPGMENGNGSQHDKPVHASEFPASLDVPSALSKRLDSMSGPDHKINIYANYAKKLRARYDNHRERYDALGPLASSIYSRLYEFLDTYEAEDKGMHARVIHGDPVFSNAILCDNGREVRFVDVRCQLEDTLTPEGDVHYDLAKVFQSLSGYDHILFLLAESERNHTNAEALLELSAACSRAILAGKPSMPRLVGAEDRRLLEELQESYFDFIREEYSIRIHRKTLYRITASLLFSLIPLHRPQLGPMFLCLCNTILEKAGGINAM